MAEAGGIVTRQESCAPGKPVDTGLGCLALVLAFAGEAFDIERARREYLAPGTPSNSEDLIRIARAEGYKARATRSSVQRLSALPLPVIARRRDGSFFVLGRRTEAGVLVGEGGGPPAEWKLEQLAQEWTGEVLFVVKRDKLKGDVIHFGLKWFLPAVRKFSKIFAEVLLISVFIPLLALVSPLFFQVVIDKVLVYRALTTLEVLVIGLLVVNVADVSLNWLRTYAFAHTTSRVDAILGSLLFRHLMALPIGYFESRAT